ncbi:sialidase family protein [Runella sp.]|jgi:sialidase-1|uniref:sialidase family protein n=1 Tax=Runella sp. TaxID=1960881 RepID=UPI0026082B0C|nr:sialidase family protein [Runella sp.]
MHLPLFLLLLIPTFCIAQSSTGLQSPKETVVFQNGQDGYKCYRIPAIVKAPNGDLLAFAEARRNNCGDFGDVEIVMKRSKDNGVSWGKLQIAADNGNDQAGNQAPVFDLKDKQFPKGRLFLFYNTGIAHEQEVREGKAIREVWYKTSTDNGQTWSEPVNITTQVSKPNQPEINPNYHFKEDWRSYANTPGHGLQIQKGNYKGRIFIAANHSAGPPQKQSRDYVAHAFYSDDHGKTFKLSPNVAYASSNEAIAAETSDGSLLFNCRNQSGGAKYRIQAFTKNAGETWDEVKIMNDLPDPVCQGSMIDFQPKKGQKVLIFSNANSQTKREKLTVRVSYDDGKSWSAGKEIYGGPAAYSDLVVQKDKNIGVLYEKDDYTQIVYAFFRYDWLEPHR